MLHPTNSWRKTLSLLEPCGSFPTDWRERFHQIGVGVRGFAAMAAMLGPFQPRIDRIDAAARDRDGLAVHEHQGHAAFLALD